MSYHSNVKQNKERREKMKKTILKLNTFIFAIMAMFAMTMTVFAEDYFRVKGKEGSYDTLKKALAAVDENGVIELIKSVTYNNASIVISDKKFTLDLGGNVMNFEGDLNSGYSGIVVGNTDITIRNGEIKSSVTTESETFPTIIFAYNNSNVNLESAKLTMTGNGSAINLYTFKGLNGKVTLNIDPYSTVIGSGEKTKATITNYCTDAVIDVYGTVKHSKTYSAINNGKDGIVDINIHEGALIESTSSTGLLLLGKGNTVIEGTVKGYSSGVAMVNGSLDVKEGAQVIATGTVSGHDSDADGSVLDNGASVFALPDKDVDVTVKVEGGVLTSQNNAAISAPGDNSKLNISVTDGTLTGNSEVGAVAVNGKTKFISGGVFSSNVMEKDYLTSNEDVVSLTHNNSTNYYVGENTFDVASLAQSGDVIDVLKGDYKPTETLRENVTVKNSGEGEVVVNDTPVTKDEPYTTPVVNTGSGDDKENTILEGVTYETEEDITILGKVITEKDDTYEEMIKLAVEKGYDKLYQMYEFYEKDGKSLTKPLIITFELGSKYNSKEVYIIHKLHDGTYQKVEEVVKNGKVSITVNELSPFIIALKEEEKVEEEKKDPTPNNAQTSSMNTALYGITGIASLTGLVIVAKKRKANN